MICASIGFSEIDYRATASNLVPKVIDRLGDADSENLLRRFLGRINAETSMLLIEALNRLPEAQKAIVLVQVLNRFDDSILQRLNQSLLAHPLTQDIAVGRFSIEWGADTIQYRLLLDALEVKYEKLIVNPAIQARVSEALPALEALVREKAAAMTEQLNDSTGMLRSLARRIPLERLAERAMEKSENRWISLSARLLHSPLDRACVQVLETEVVKQALLERAATALADFGVAARLNEVIFSFSKPVNQWKKPAGASSPRVQEFMTSDILQLETRRAVIDAFFDTLQLRREMR